MEAVVNEDLIAEVRTFKLLEVLSTKVASAVDCDMCFMKLPDMCWKGVWESSDGRVVPLAVCFACLEKMVDESTLKEKVEGMFAAQTSEAVAAATTAGSLSTHSEYMDALFTRDSMFTRNLEEFAAGAFTLSDGSEEEILASISRAVTDRRRISDKQITAFNSVCGKLLVAKRSGEPLKSLEKTRITGVELEDMNEKLELLAKHGDGYGKKIAKSFMEQCKARRFLSEKQGNLLNKLFIGLDLPEKPSTIKDK